MTSAAAGEDGGPHRSTLDKKRSRKDDKLSDRDQSEKFAEENRGHRRHFRDSERRRNERRRSRTRSPVPAAAASAGGRTSGAGRRRHSPDYVPRSRSHFQNEELGNGGGESSGARAFERGRYNDSKKHEDKVPTKASPSVLEMKNEKSLPHKDSNNVWRHDGFYELDKEPQVPRKRPAFREIKTKTDAANSESVREPRLERLASSSDKREEERNHRSRGFGRYERPISVKGDRELGRVVIGQRRTETPRYGYQSRDRYNGPMGSRSRGDYNVTHNERNSLPSGGLQVEKWKHDLFDEANKSPNRKNEEEQIAKVEALLGL